MDLRFTPDELAFRDEVRAFFRESLPANIRRKMELGQRQSKEDIVGWQRILNAKGWAVPHWPAEWGGRDWGPVKSYIFKEEMQLAPAPDPLSFNVNMVGPVLVAFGSEEQKRRFLPKIANLDIWFCQGFSEPGAGSDLASLKTAARLEGDHYVVNGQKIWTSYANHADFIILLVRTDPAAKRHQGISVLLVPMDTPGIEVREIPSIVGDRYFHEVFFTDARVPVDCRLGPENGGWDVVTYALAFERSGAARYARAALMIDRLAEHARLVEDDGASCHAHHDEQEERGENHGMRVEDEVEEAHIRGVPRLSDGGEVDRDCLWHCCPFRDRGRCRSAYAPVLTMRRPLANGRQRAWTRSPSHADIPPSTL